MTAAGLQGASRPQFDWADNDSTTATTTTNNDDKLY